jgi:type IV pilus assembly protein PilE
MTTKSSGFTLIELLVVVAIIGILSAVGIVSYNGYVKSTKRNSAENILQQIALAQTEYYSNTGSYYITGGAGTCTADGTTSVDIEDNLFDGENIVPGDIDFEICTFGNTASYTVYAQETKPGSTCVITVTKYGTPQRTGC